MGCEGGRDAAMLNSILSELLIGISVSVTVIQSLKFGVAGCRRLKVFCQRSCPEDLSYY